MKDFLEKIEVKSKVKVLFLSRVSTRPLSAHHDCLVRIGPVNPIRFVWLILHPKDAGAVVFFKHVQF